MNQKSPNRGLSSKEAAYRLKKNGPNSLPTSQHRTFFHIILEMIWEPMFLLLVLATTVYLIFGDLREGLSLTTFVSLIIIITLYQQGKTENALKALRDLTSPRALVNRDGEWGRISAREVVLGDIVFINEGDRIPADGVLLSAHDLQVDESLLSGEAFPVNKKIGDFVYSGTMVVQGQGMFEVTATGCATKIGQIGVALKTLEIETSPLQKQTAKLIKIFAALGLTTSFLLVILLGLIQHDWLKASLAGIALAMSLLPEEIPVTLTLFPALGAWRLSKHHVLTRRISAIETLGAISILCVDKTGTITENCMTVTQLWANDKFYDVTSSHHPLPEEFHSLIEYAILSSEINPFDPMEKGLHDLGKHFLAQTEHLHSNWRLVHEYDRTSEIPAKTHIWQGNEQLPYVVAAKGAPETIMDLCHLEDSLKQTITLAIKKMATEGLRVLAVAKATFKGEKWPTSQQEFNFTFLGIVGSTDPIRKGIPEAVTQCHEAGIRIIMITGDYPETAKTIAKRAGLTTQNTLTGDTLNTLDDAKLQQTMQNVSICARITPEQKLRIIQAIKKQGNIVGMTGDGVNDAPALKSAHVGIAMGTRGTDVAREASSLILVDDNFASIVGAIQFGRNIFDNIKKSISYIISVHIPIAGMALLPILFGLPGIFYPMHIAFLQLIIDPVCSLAFENEPPEPDLMKRQPRNTELPLIDRETLIYSFIQGIGILLISLTTYYFSLQILKEGEAKAFTFVSLIVANLLLIFWHRTRKHPIFGRNYFINKTLLVILICVLISLLAVIYLPFLANLFQFTPLSWIQLTLSACIGITSLLWFELVRLFITFQSD
ncbi:MAG: cation-translocating P-type ATPase [Candidatus Berkiellales bacterium]